MRNTFSRLLAFWRRRSLKFWLATGMLMAVFPIFACALAGYFRYHQAIIQPLIDVAAKQRSILQPLHTAQTSLWDVSDAVTDYALDGQANHVTAYRQHANEINAALSDFAASAPDHSRQQRKVRESWRQVMTLSNAILSNASLHGDAAVSDRLETFDAHIKHLGQRLDTVYEGVRLENERTHNQALDDLEKTELLALGGFVLAVIFAALGCVIINRSLVNSMDKLALGAIRLAAGDREHRIEVHIPHELANVADAFNLMTNQILDQEEALARAATIDALTGLFNRREFDRMLANALTGAQCSGETPSLIMTDIDHVKRFNDTHGHQGGDEALRSVARTIQQALREGDKACRFGGEEFVLILPDCNAQNARQTAERVRAAVQANDIQLDDDQTARVTISMGVATYPQAGRSAGALLKSADIALYHSKENGRNRVTLAT